MNQLIEYLTVATDKNEGEKKNIQIKKVSQQIQQFLVKQKSQILID